MLGLAAATLVALPDARALPDVRGASRAVARSPIAIAAAGSAVGAPRKMAEHRIGRRSRRRRPQERVRHSSPRRPGYKNQGTNYVRLWRLRRANSAGVP